MRIKAEDLVIGAKYFWWKEEITFIGRTDDDDVFPHENEFEDYILSDSNIETYITLEPVEKPAKYNLGKN